MIRGTLMTWGLWSRTQTRPIWALPLLKAMCVTRWGTAPGVKERSSPIRSGVSKGRGYLRERQWDNDRGNSKWQLLLREGIWGCNACKNSACFYAPLGPPLRGNPVLGWNGVLRQALPSSSGFQLTRPLLPSQQMYFSRCFPALTCGRLTLFSPLFSSVAPHHHLHVLNLGPWDLKIPPVLV